MICGVVEYKKGTNMDLSHSHALQEVHDLCDCIVKMHNIYII
jgi:ABC-type Na+ transport system ATPase subunit NatA